MQNKGYQKILKINCQKVERDILNFIKKIVKEANANGVVIGLSGGIDSSIAAILSVKALGSKRVLGLLMPYTSITPITDIQEAEKLSKELDIEFIKIPIESIVKSLLENISIHKDKIALANLMARIRMAICYFFANSLNYLVVGTADKSELLIGYFTKHGDGGFDFAPIAHLYKTQLKQLGKFLELSQDIITKPSSPQLWSGQKAIDEIPVDYDILDLILYYILEKKMEFEEVASKLKINIEVIQEVYKCHIKTMHKRKKPPIVSNFFKKN